MEFSGHKTGCSGLLILAAATGVVFWIGGCGEIFSHKHAELESRNILKDLSTIYAAADANIPLPQTYKQPPQVLETKDGVKLFYFTQYHTVEKLASSDIKNPGLIQQQFGYKVSQNPATNQLIISCPSPEEADMVLEFLKQVDVPPIQVKIDCLVSELYADWTMDQETTILVENLFGENILLGGKTDSKTGELLPAFPGASLREVARSRMGLQAGYSINEGIVGHRFKAMVDILESRGYLKILMNPVLEVVNGETAKIMARDYVPLPKEVTAQGGRDILPYMTTEYQWVVDSLEITPHVFADGYIGLQTTVQIASKSTPEGVKQIPIITERQVQNKENRIRRGDSLVIGGIRKSEKRDVVRGVPFLKDIPIIGILFSSRDFEERAKEVMFILTPSISTGGIPREELIEKVERKHEAPFVPQGLQETFTDPFGQQAENRLQRQETAQAQQTRAEVEAARAEARDAVNRAQEQLELAEALAQQASLEAHEAKTEAAHLKDMLEQSEQRSEETQKPQEKPKEENQQSQAETEKSKKDAQQGQS